ncbi:hypothetical protein P170DRAFT_404792 [Aspergillus steynii IBT 23096]|uniref:Subtelomeric hrmA-associated cluster protein AFUB-079030/YDR124W-like helical bundle domain-containing protein n=1 Tax=Aspergillus steynii IBT 23096 TaxID=1392250 RepID=A0A2I2GB05_9EURO|nr:uncharacterized protein P170DRAFT_404792 [Aspergillus steynii IBT 23096]PLB50062.1 hypothetical protein P170DRAFT_404792 [Aspergillus steynii IBT 23096]
MDAPLDGQNYMHFALIYLDEGGKLRFEASPSIASNCQSVLSPNVTDSFLRAVALSNKNGTPKLIGSPGSQSDDARGKSPLSPQSPNQGSSRGSSMFHDGNPTKRKRVSHECVVPMSINCHQKTMLPIRNRSLLRRYYEKAFESLQQINCRILAKAYIKLVEPRKQVNFPYNGRKIISGTSQQFDPELTKPAWWPSGVTHREPDHLLKPERIRLLVHILCELRTSHAICVDRLKEADQSIRRSISPQERMPVLDEIYSVREEEENYLDGRTDGQAVVCVSRVHLPDMADSHGMGSSTGSMLKSEINPVYRREVPDMESHTSVFPTTGGSPTSDSAEKRRKESSKLNHSLPATWDHCVPPSLPSLSNPKRARDSDSSYPVDISNPPLFHHDTPTSMPLDSQTFPLRYYNEPHLNHHHSQSQQTLPVLGLSGTELGGCPQPYYFNY